jgi:Family of unknown function (DUF5989)
MNKIMSDEKKQNEFESAGQEKNAGIVSEFMAMIRQNKKYWLIPIIVILLLVGVLIILGSTAAAPFIYTLF